MTRIFILGEPFFRLVWLQIDGFHWLRWGLFHLPGPSIFPKGHRWSERDSRYLESSGALAQRSSGSDAERGLGSGRVPAPLTTSACFLTPVLLTFKGLVGVFGPKLKLVAGDHKPAQFCSRRQMGSDGSSHGKGRLERRTGRVAEG